MLERQFLLAIYGAEANAQRAVDALIEAGFPMDRISVLGKLQHSGDDVLGVVYPEVGERARVWASHGAIWGGLLGALAGAIGVFLIPGLGTVLVIGPLVNAIAGATTGAVLGGGALAGAAALSEVSVALHREGMPEHALAQLHAEIEAGRIVVVLQSDSADELTPYRSALERGQPLRVQPLPESIAA
ncbi:MAG: general stress protein [Thiotrichales bacterium]